MSRARVAGMPSNKALRHQALQLAQGGVQSKRSITRQYKRAQGDTAGFTSALVSLLKGEQGTAGAAYGQAVSQQQQIDQAARQQLGNLGEDYGGAAVKVGATGDSAISGLLAGQAAAQDYASRQPGIAAGRGALAQTGLQNALEDALAQRADAIHQAFPAAYQSVRQNDFNEAMALQNLGLQRQQFAFQQQQATLAQSNADRAFNEQVREFNVSQRDQRQAQAIGGISPPEYRQEAKVVSDYALGSPPDTTKVPVYKWAWKDANDHSKGRTRIVAGYKQEVVKGSGSPDIVQQGILFPEAMQTLTSQGVNPAVALSMLTGLYRKYKAAPNGTYEFDAYQSFRQFMGGTPWQVLARRRVGRHPA